MSLLKPAKNKHGYAKVGIWGSAGSGIADGQSITINEKLISPKDIYYGFSAGIQP